MHELIFFASKIGGQFAPARGGQFDRHIHSDIRLTNAIDLLQKAKDSISDFIDDTNK